MYVGAYIKVKMPEYEDEADYKLCPDCGRKIYGTVDTWCSRDGARLYRETVTKYVHPLDMLHDAFGEYDVMTSAFLSNDLSVVAFYANQTEQGGLHFSDEENAEFEIPVDNRDNKDYATFIIHLQEIGAEYEVKYGIITDSREL